ncbi:protein flightless-1 [Galendromus occidentalis]|uniref:Protein flightless-1 n=1 Tax=Galendromus occidentalis TaxID=34638 RepID=A0AAJ7L7J4_9ACAR|nr:protein flightless-1 [Galendromus occidentalis]
MSAARTGLLPFVRGIDLARNDLQEDNFPRTVAEMVGLRWLRLDRTNLDGFPDEMSRLQKLESLHLQRNNLSSIFGAIPTMKNLRYLNCHHNKLTSVPPDLGLLEELTVLDLSHNDLREVPENLEKAVYLTVLNLSYNRIESIPQHLFLNLLDLVYLDMSGNQLETLPPQMRRLVFLETLLLNDSPKLGNYQLKQLHALTSLRTLHVGNAARTLTNTPLALDMTSLLSDIDFSSNNLPRVPDMLYALKTLRRLNLSDNCITELSPEIGDSWKLLETLNVSRNKLVALPSSLCKCSQLRRLYVNDNRIDFDGIPSGIGKLHNLQVFQAANNNLEMIPEGVVRCGRLKKLVLANNRLITVPEAIHLLTDLEVLDLSNNPDLMMPPKPQQTFNGSAEYYNIDFSLQTQMRLAGAQLPAQLPPLAPTKDPIARKQRLRRRRGCDEETDDTEKVLKGMKELATRKNVNGSQPDTPISLKPKNWEDALEKPPIDYSELFEEDVGQMPGVFVWEIDNLLPVPLDDDYIGKFFEGDCYIVMLTYLDEAQNLAWKIHYWIGRECALDKQACSAIHAVNLRNFLGARCRTVRNEQGDESDEFLEFFPEGVEYLTGGRTQSGLYSVEEIEYATKLYRISANHAAVHVENVEPCVESLDSSHVFVLDGGLKIFVWSGRNSKCTVSQKGRLLAEKINKIERKDNAEIFDMHQGKEPVDFWSLLGVKHENEEELKHIVIPKNRVPADWKPKDPRLYQVHLRPGYLELPQVELKEGKLVKELLETEKVYILDCFTDVYIWWGKKSTKLVKSASMKLGQELLGMMPRPQHVTLVRTLEGNEPMVFKSKFVGWDDVIAVDFTRTATSVARTGADLKKWMTTQETKVDLAALFSPRQILPTAEETEKFMETINEDLDVMECFVLEGKKFVKLPEEEFGHFYSQDCYVFMCRYWILPENATATGSDDHPDSVCDEDADEDFKCVVYFWQGRDASNMGWLTFTFSLHRRFEQLFGDKLDVQRTYQQQETDRFLAHFRKNFVIHTGSRKDKSKPLNALYHIRANGSPIFTRCIQIEASAENLNSAFCYILRVPFNNEDAGVLYVWMGKKAPPDLIDTANEIAPKLCGSANYGISHLNEGDEPDNFFWVALGGRKDYFTDASFMSHLRLFRCSNDKGYFSVTEKCIDFCQDDLADEDIMILDEGEDVFIWVGSKCSEVEIKLALKSAQVYVQSMRAKNPEQPRKLKLTLKGKESRRFKKCFHGWGKFKQVAEWSG